MQSGPLPSPSATSYRLQEDFNMPESLYVKLPGQFQNRALMRDDEV
jgi:hypothetical protein